MNTQKDITVDYDSGWKESLEEQEPGTIQTSFFTTSLQFFDHHPIEYGKIHYTLLVIILE